MEILEVKNIGFKYALGKSKVLKDISFKVSKGEWVYIAGLTGSGKSTLLKLLKKEITMSGEFEGEILFEGNNIEALSVAESASKIGYVCQNPTEQIVTDKVWHELCFGLENLGVNSDEIRRRVAETASYFGIEDWYEKNTNDLSGGQKQLLNLAAVMIMEPKVLLLDEPVSQLDPISAENFFSFVLRLHEDFGITIIMIEHNMERVLGLCDRVLCIEKGELKFNGQPSDFVAQINSNSDLFMALPTGVKLFKLLNGDGKPTFNICDSRKLLEKKLEKNELKSNKNCNAHEQVITDSTKECALNFENVFFSYSKNEKDTLHDLNLDVHVGEIFSIVGGNGSGKTTAMLVASGVNKPYSGKVKIFGKGIKEYKNQSLYKNCLTLMPQEVQTMFLCDTVAEELRLNGIKSKDDVFDFTEMLETHPYDLSGGQQQLLALSIVLANNPGLLLMDEPTKGLDYSYKKKLADVISNLKRMGITIVIVTHDLEFAATVSDRCALLFKGEIVSCDRPGAFFSKSTYYTTSAAKIAKGYVEGAICIDTIIEALQEQSVD